ncbi:MAG TPA: glycosyltransferase family A protein [Tepidisphaeraceae bacterium]|nr:glycosyltransferase family A protein [Tepidisphaeraceae bacterium]
MISIIIPAHNEAAVIGRCLSSLLDGSQPGELELIIVCNGCTDNTAAIARGFGEAVRVIETDIPSKVNALNLGDRAASHFPRLYVDADVGLTLDSVRRIVSELENGGFLAAAPQIRLDLDGCSWAVRAFYEIDGRLPSHREGIGGSGVYAMSAEGRARFGEFPKVTADDAFVRRHFRPEERITVPGTWSCVKPPKALRGLIKIKTRSHLGNYEIEERYPHLTANRGTSNRPALLALALKPWFWPCLAVYGYVKAMARLRAIWQLRVMGGAKWERDETSRQPVSASERIGA